MGTSSGALAMAVAAALGLAACAQKPPGAVSVIEDKVYSVTPSTVPVAAGIVVGELTELKVTERVEQGTGRIDSPARLSGSLKLKNTSKDQSVRLVGASVRFVDRDGKIIPLETARTESNIRFSNAKTERLDPGQDTTDAVNIDVPIEALKKNTLKEIRLELTYLPSAFKHETVNLAVSIGGQ